MSILSSIGSGLSSAWNWAKNAVSDVASAVGLSGKSQSASVMDFNVGNNLNGYGTTTPKATSQSNGITYYNNYVPLPSSLNGPMTVNPALVNPPKTISTGASTQTPNYSPITGYSNRSQFTIQPTTYSSPKTLTSSMLSGASPIISSAQTPIATANFGSVNTASTTNTITPSVARIMNDVGQSNITPSTTRITTPAGKTQEVTDKTTKDMQTLIDEQSRIAPPQVNYEDLYRQAKQESGVDSKQIIVNDLSNRLNEINNRINGDILRLRGVGAREGVTEAVYGQQVAEIAREGQLQSLPIEAQLNAAQGDLKMAENNLDMLFKVKTSSAEANFKRWTNIVDNARDAFNKQEQRQIDDMKTKFTYNASRVKDATNFAQSIALEALKNGNPKYVNLLSKLTEPDPTSPTFNEELQAYNQQLSIYASQLDIPTASEVVQIDPTSNSILAQTGLSIPAFGFLTQGTAALTRLSSGERQKFMKEAEAWANKNGIDISSFKSQYEAYNTALQNNIKRFNNTQIMEGEILGTVENLSSAADAKEFGKLKFTNVAKLLAGEQVNDPITLKYAVHLNQLVSELAGYNAAVQGRTSTDLVDIEEAKRVIKTGMSSKGLTGFTDAIKSSVTKMGKTLQDSVDRTQGQVWNLFGVKKPSGSQLQSTNENYSSSDFRTKYGY